jgi:hypothetical protein
MTATSEKWKRLEIIFEYTGKASLPPTFTHITEALNGLQETEWASASDHQMILLFEQNHLIIFLKL